MTSSQTPQQIKQSKLEEIASAIFEQLEKFKVILDTDPKILTTGEVERFMCR